MGFLETIQKYRKINACLVARENHEFWYVGDAPVLADDLVSKGYFQRKESVSFEGVVVPTYEITEKGKRFRYVAGLIEKVLPESLTRENL